MVIHDRSYARWDGDKLSPVKAVPVMLDAGIKRGVAILFKKKIPALLLILAAYGTFVFFLGLIYIRYYILQNAEKFPGGMAEAMQEPEIAAMTTANAEHVFFYLFNLQWPFVLIACVMIGSGLISNDRRENALELYLSRPVTVRQYLLGKLGTIAFFLGIVTLAPAIVLLLAQLSLSWSEPGEAWRLTVLILRTIPAGLVWILLASLTISAASSLTQKARNAAILWLAVMLLLGLVSGIMMEVFGNQGFSLLQMDFNIRQVAAWMLGDTKPSDFNPNVPLWQSAAVLVTWCVLCVWVMLKRVKPVEIVA
ncbi:MAG: ABC transporter permease [Planctomycetota bacterium]|jgi:ABC-type transport system involved in multi-copper enzyme maturation permease subunit